MEEYLDEYPGAEWDPERYDTLDQEFAEIDEALNEEMEKLKQLKVRIIQETGSENPGLGRPDLCLRSQA